MKKLLLNLTLLVFCVNYGNAQDFDYNMLGRKDDVTIIQNEVVSGVTKNNITLSPAIENPKIGSASSDDLQFTAEGDNTYIQFRSEGPKLQLTSLADMRKIAIQYRGTGNTSKGIFILEYGSSSNGTLTTYTSLGVTATAPGSVEEFTFPAGVRYVRIRRSGALRIYRLAASTTEFSLPLDFLSFTAKPDALGKSINLNWQTTNEVNTKEFIIEKRTSNTEFTAIDTKPSNNTAGVHNYSYTDNNVSNGVVYYRLKQVDNDGVFDYSAVASADIKGTLSFSVYPNPTEAILNVVHESAATASTIKVLNLSGKTLLENNVNTGSTTTNINVSSLSSGAYVLLYDGGDQQNAVKFMKQ